MGNDADAVTVDHNTVVHTGPSLVLMYAAPITNSSTRTTWDATTNIGFIGDSHGPGKGLY